MMKHLAVVSAVVLVGGYIILKTGAGGLMPASKSARIAIPADDVDDSPATAPSTQPGFRLKEPIAKEFEVMSSSKSGPVVRASAFDRDEVPATNPTTTPSK